MADENERVRLLQGIKASLNALKNNALQADREEALEKDKTARAEYVHRYKKERDSALEKFEVNSLIPGEHGPKTLEQEHLQALDQLLARLESNTYQDIGTSIMNLLAVLIKSQAAWQHFWEGLPHYARKVIEDHVTMNKEGCIDSARRVAEVLTENGFDFGVVGVELLPRITYNEHTGLQVDLKNMEKATQHEKNILTHDLTKVTDYWLATQGYVKEANGKYAHLANDGTRTPLTAQVFETKKNAALTGLGAVISRGIEEVAPENAPPEPERPGLVRF